MSTYNQLVADIIKYSHRNELDLMIPTFIKLTEETMYSNDEEPLQVRHLEFTSTTTTNDELIALPNNFEKMRSLILKTDNNNHQLIFQAPSQLIKRAGTGRPRFYTIVSNVIEFEITPDNEYTLELQYYRKATPITADNQTNEILTNHYSIYLFGALYELFSHVLDTEQEQRYLNKYIASIKGANKADKKGRYGVNPTVSLNGVTP